MEQTSLNNRNESFYSQIEKFGIRRRTVYNLIQEYGELTAQEIKSKMVLGVNQVSGRITELKELFYIVPVGSKNGVSRVKNTIWRVTAPVERDSLIHEELINLSIEKHNLEFDINNYFISNGLKEMGVKRLTKINELIKKLEK